MRQPFFLGLLALLVVSAGCRRDLGECNLDNTSVGVAAQDIAYQITDGLPMYEGQALYQQSCGNGQFCHSPNAVGADRFGAPFGLNFDVALACTDSDPACATTDCSADPNSAICQSFGRLQLNATRAFDEGGLSIGQIRRGSMPPGEAGRVVKGNTTFLRLNDAMPLPGLETPEGEEIVRNWLACGAPVVSRTDTPSSPSNQLRDCPSTNGEVCIFRGPSLIPDPTWSSIYETLIFRQCVSCHGPSNGNTDANPNNPLVDGIIPGGASPQGLLALDLSGSDLTDTSGWGAEAHGAVVNVVASGVSDCAGMGTLVVPNDAANSLLYQKLIATQLCGDVMPPNDNQIPTIAPAVSDIVEEWILAGANND